MHGLPYTAKGFTVREMTMAHRRGRFTALLAVCTWTWTLTAAAQSEVPADTQPAEPRADEDTPPRTTAAPTTPSPPTPEGAPPAERPQSVTTSAAQAATADAALSAAQAQDTSAAADAMQAAEQPVPAPAPATPTLAGSHTRRLILRPGFVPFTDGPLSLSFQNADYLQQRRQNSGIAVSDTAAALGLGAPGMTRLELRVMPTLVLLNGRRLVIAPASAGELGADFVDLGQIPIGLVGRIEIAKGTQTALYGSDAIGGVINVVTRRDYDGFEADVELGGQVTDGFEQDEEDVTVSIGYGSRKGGVSATINYFRRQPLAATDRPFIGERAAQLDSLTSNPSSYYRLVGGENRLADPNCDTDLARELGANVELRVPGYGPLIADVPYAQQPAYVNVVPPERRTELEMNYDNNGDGAFSQLEFFAFCTGDFTRNLDLVLEEQRIQAYTTGWYELGEVELFAEAGYYRNDNQNRTAASFPILNRLSPELYDPTRDPSDPEYDASVHREVTIPLDLAFTSKFEEHQDIPAYVPFTTQSAEGTRAGQLLIGRTEGNYAPPRLNERDYQIFRGVLGIGGELDSAGLEDWDWELSGTYSLALQEARVDDVIVDNLVTALESCGASTVSQRQLDGCYNPFFSSVLNSAVLNSDFRDRSVPSRRGYPITDRDGDGMAETPGGFVVDGACRDSDDDTSDPAIAALQECPAGFDSRWSGTVNSAEVIDRITGQSTSDTKRELLSVDGIVRGKLLELPGGPLGFALGGQFRRETLNIGYDSIYNDNGYVFLFGGPDLEDEARHVIAGFAELRWPLARGFELQTAGRYDRYDDVGGAPSALGGVAWRPFVSFDEQPAPALEWLIVRGSVAIGHQPPSLLQLHGMQVRLEEVDYQGATHFLPYRIQPNTDLGLERVLGLTGGLEWDFEGLHVVADYYRTHVTDVIAAPNPRTLGTLCSEYFETVTEPCDDIVLGATGGGVGGVDLQGFASPLDNMAKIETDGIDGAVGYTLDSKRQNLGEFGTIALFVQGSYLNSYFITDTNPLTLSRIRAFERNDPDAVPVSVRNPRRVLREHYQDGFEAAGERNYDNFAPPLPQLRASVPLSWSYEGHTLMFVTRYIDSYIDSSENTIEELGYEPEIPSQITFDASYAYTFSVDTVQLRVRVGVINIADADPPVVEGSGLGYEVGVHDPRGRTIHARVGGRF